MRTFHVGFVFVLCLASSLVVRAEPAWPEYLDIDFSYRNSALVRPKQRLDFRLGVGLEREPTFQGSDRSRSEVDPFLVAAYRADWGNLFLTGSGVGYSRTFTPRFGLALQLEAEDTRETDDDDRLRGLGDQEQELELEIIGRYLRGPWQVGASVALATGDKGIVWFVGGSRTWRLASDRLFLTVNADLSGSSAANQQTDFGITASQAANSVFGYPEYAPNGGLKSFGLALSFDYRLSDRWMLYGEVENERLLGDVADSPLVTMSGSKNNLEAAIGFYYRF